MSAHLFFREGQMSYPRFREGQMSGGEGGKCPGGGGGNCPGATSFCLPRNMDQYREHAVWIPNTKL